MWCITQHEGGPIAETEALKLNNYLNKVTSIVCRDSLLVSIVNPVMNFSAAFGKEHGMCFLAARIVDIVEDVISSDLLTGNSSQTYWHYIWVAKFLYQRRIITNNIENLDGKELRVWMLDTLHLNDGSLFSS